MHLIIDGYNLVGVTTGFGGSLEGARDALTASLAAYRRNKHHPITVVFDGWKQGLPNGGHEHRSGVQVLYSKKGERADQVIQRLARQYGNACAVVSSDHEVAEVARSAGAFVMTAQEFAAKLRALPSVTGTPFKELDVGEDRPSRNPDKKGNPRKLPKAARQRSRQLKRF
jgi:predicted RNA-binding protein with PIN domain